MLSFFLFLYFNTQGLELSNYENLIHYGTVKFGQQDINVLFDTGSSLSWVASTDCKSCGSAGYTKYSQYLSSSVKFLHQSFELEYGSGSIRGELGLETVEINNLVLTNIQVGIVTEEIGLTFKHLPINGIIALAPGQGKTSLMSRLRTEHNITNIEISLSDSVYSKGSLEFFQSYSIFKEKTLIADKWTVQFAEILFGELDFCKFIGKCRAVVDTGTSLIILPKGLYREVSKRYRLQADCKNFAEMPELEMKIGDWVYEIGTDGVIVYDQGVCTLAFMQMELIDQEGSFIVLGGTFLRNCVIILDFSSDSIAIRPKFPIFAKNKLALPS